MQRAPDMQRALTFGRAPVNQRALMFRGTPDYQRAPDSWEGS